MQTALACAAAIARRVARKTSPSKACLAAALATALSGCIVSAPADMAVPSPDNHFTLSVDFSGGGLTLSPGVRAALSLQSRGGEATEFRTLEAVRQLQIAWTAPRVVRICAGGSQPETRQTVSVPAADGEETFEIVYACQTADSGPGEAITPPT